MRNYLSKKWN